ncbi:GNAT family N-acetyltransferase [Paramicrobacterium agarici]|uniref:GNAT family N-acetyltransferase n=1 Tax=Paramicrobacterium agarici TaxID=630514 RepID=UPI00114F9C70|nr:GNAT family N-acetyltransferase [Microbacterium agarici]TQO21613.1 putative acetyltransferase [Microbacterium agarici]
MLAASDVTIRPLAVDDEAEAQAAHKALAADGFSFLLEQVEGQSWHDYVQRLAEIERGERLAPGRVPAAFLVAEVDGRIAGRVSVRFELNDYLADVGGHIGYGVVPRFRRRGVASALLRRGLHELAARGTERALITCDDDNVASKGVIVRAGGVPDARRPRAVRDGEAKLRFFVPAVL